MNKDNPSKRDKTSVLLKDKTVFRWYKNMQRSSEITADIYLRLLRRFCDKTENTPKGLVKTGKRSRRKVEDILMDFIDAMEKKNYSPGYIDDFKKAVVSWMTFNEISFKRKIWIKNIHATPTLEDERVPTKEELDQIFSLANVRTRVIIALISQAGLRPESIGNYRGTDGLRVKDFPDMEINGKMVSFTKVPTKLVVRSELSKAGHKYFTLLTRQGCDFLKAYLEERLASGEVIDVSSAIVAIKRGREKAGKPIDSPNYGSSFIQTGNIGDAVREALRPRFKWRPYVLRAYFDTQLLQAESHGQIPQAFRKFFMGHTGDIEARYTTNKGRLPDALVDDMRRCFTQSQKFLESVEREVVDNKKMLLEMWKQQAKLYGIDPAEILKQRQRKGGFSQDEDIQILQSEIKNSIMKVGASEKPFKSKIVNEEELVKLVGDGWDLVKELSNGKFLVRCSNAIAA